MLLLHPAFIWNLPHPSPFFHCWWFSKEDSIWVLYMQTPLETVICEQFHWEQEDWPLYKSKWEWSCRTGFLLSIVSIDQNFNNSSCERGKKRPLFTEKCIGSLVPPLIPWLEVPVLWYLYVGHHHPFSEDCNTLSHCIQVVNISCYPIHDVSFSLYFERKSVGSKS